MKCPFCGQESTSQTTCSNCGKKISAPQEEIEVEYKEFTLSEFLEIRKKQEQSAGTVPAETRRSFNKNKGAPSLQEEKSWGGITERRIYLLIMASLGLVAVIIGGFFLLKLFLH